MKPKIFLLLLALIAATAQPALFHPAASLAEVGSGACSSETVISVPFSQNGAGEFCWVADGQLNHVNSWNMQSVEVNGQDFTNTWSSQVPASADGRIHIHYQATAPWAHFRIAGVDSDEPPPATQYHLTTRIVGQGSVTPGSSGTYDEGTLVTLFATPAAGYQFQSWSGDALDSVAVATLIMDEDKTVVAVFVQDDQPQAECGQVSEVSAPITIKGPGSFCLFTRDNLDYVNSWLTDKVEINGEDRTNQWSRDMPVKQDGGYYITVEAPHAWSHFEAARSDVPAAPEDPEPQGQVIPAEGDWRHTQGNRIVDRSPRERW